MIEDIFFLLKSRIIISIIFANIISHILKIFFDYKKTKKIDVTKFFRSGGMPSAHSASAMALCTGIYLTEGVTNLFIVTIFFAAVVMYDSRGVRYEASKHARLLNMLMKKGKFQFPKLKEIIGHSITEVIAGAIVGVIVTYGIFLL